MITKLICKYLGLLDSCGGCIAFFGIPIFLLWVLVETTYFFGTVLKGLGLL